MTFLSAGVMLALSSDVNSHDRNASAIGIIAALVRQSKGATFVVVAMPIVGEARYLSPLVC